MIEPAAYGAAVAFGPQTHNFRDVVALMLERRAAVVVHNAYDITAFVRQCLENQAYAAELGERARQLIGGQLGAVERTARQVFALVEQPRGRDFLNAA
jgi:3-deoxy-D-manno-octulosonic-acid transferase